MRSTRISVAASLLVCWLLSILALVTQRNEWAGFAKDHAAKQPSLALLQAQAAAGQRKLLGLTSSSSSASQPLYHFHAQLWAVLRPANASWTVAWADLFGELLPAPESLAFGAGEGTDSSSMSSVMQAYNSRYELSDAAGTWQQAIQDDLPSLRVVGAIWGSSKEREGNVSALTLVTSANHARLDQLRAQCLAWPGVTSVAFHYPVLQDEGAANFTEGSREKLRDMLIELAELVAEMHNTPTACSLRVVLAAEVYTERQAMMLFPVNSLRNLARLQTDTPLIALLDVDLLPSASLYHRMSDSAKAKELMKQSKDTVFVLPGFEVHHRHEHAPWADALVTAGKSLVQSAFKTHVIVQFHVEKFKAGHGPTDYSKWLEATEDYVIEYQDGYEPWLIGSRVGMPWHDERYRGFGKNKIQHILHMRVLGYQFKVLHNEYAVHRPHDLTSAALAFAVKVSKKTGQKNILKAHMFGLLEAQEAAGTDFRPVIGDPTLACIEQLTWWQLAKESNLGNQALRMRRSQMDLPLQR